MKRFLTTLCCLCLLPALFCGCAGKNIPQRKVDVYYCAADGGLENGSAILRYTAYVESDADLLHEALRLLNEVPEDAENAASSLNGIRIHTYSIENGELQIVLSQGYSKLSALQKTLARSCLILTLCGLEEVDTLSILEDDVLLESGLTRTILLPDSLPEGSGVIETSLWLPNLEQANLTEKTVQVDLSVWLNPAEGIIAELLENEQIQSCLRNPVRLRSLSIDKGVCTVDFEAGFLEAEPLNAAAERLFLYALIDSLTERSDISRVRFLCSGKSVEKWMYMDLSGEFHRETGFTDAEMNSDENQILTLYLGSCTDKIVPIKIGLPQTGTDNNSIEQVVSCLLELKDPWGYRRLIPASTTLLDWEMEGQHCTLYLTEDFHHSMYGEDMAAIALANTLIDSCSVSSVSIYTENGAYENGKYIEKDWKLVVD